ncbi:MAG: hypothetical protein JOZ96_26075 [Acidobacteria bacterium]|nr:hypothetical protein [Acidobacteriota bacterium]
MLAVLALLAVLTGQAAPDVPANERKVLTELYASTRGARWTNRDGWGSASSVCDWYGVRCEFESGDAGRPSVAGLSLDSNNLEGELPATLGELSHLKLLDVSGNKLRGRLPEGLLQRWDRHTFELDAGDNSFSNALARARVEYSASGALCSPTEDLRYRLEVDESKHRATFQSVRCVDAKSRATYCLVREGAAPPLLRLSRALGSLGFARLQAEYDFPFTGSTHGTFLTTEAVWGDGAKNSVRTYAGQGPLEAWTAQQLFLSLLAETRWESESRKPACDF